MAVNPRLYKNVGFDPVKDFTPISQITSAPLVLVARSESPYRTLNDYLEAARKQPGAITYATPGNGTMSHLMGALLSQKADVKLVHVPYRGAAPAITDLMGGTVDMLITSPASAEPMVAAGKLRILRSATRTASASSRGRPRSSRQAWKALPPMIGMDCSRPPARRPSALPTWRKRWGRR